MNSISSLPPPASEARRQLARDNARKLLARRRQRLSKIRKRAVAGSVGAFMTAWAAIGFQLVSGHDPALSKSSPVALVSKKSEVGFGQLHLDGLHLDGLGLDGLGLDRIDDDGVVARRAGHDAAVVSGAARRHSRARFS